MHGPTCIFWANLTPFSLQNDGQNCLNAWPFLPNHGASYTRNKCILPESTNLFGTISSCDCPGNASFGQHWHSPDDPPPRGSDGGPEHRRKSV